MEDELKLTPVGTYTGVCEEASRYTGTSNGYKFVRLKLKIIDALPPKHTDIVFAHVLAGAMKPPDPHRDEILDYRRKQIGIPKDPTDADIAKLVGQQFVFKLKHRAYEGKLYHDVQIIERAR